MRIGTHNGVFHADEVFAVAAILLMHPVTGHEIEIARTRDEAELAVCDIVVDVGGVHDPEKGRFDHHQRGGAGQRDNGVKFSSFGLVWAHYWHDICGSREVRDIVDRNLVCIVDALDNGQKLFEGGTPLFDGARPYPVSAVISAMNPAWHEPADEGVRFKAFMKAVEMAKAILEREIASAKGDARAAQLTREAIRRAATNTAFDPRVIIMEQFHPWVDVAVAEAPAAVYGVYPSESGTWMVQAIPPERGSFAQRRPLPEPWAGIRGAELTAITGVPGSVFCHPGRFICGAETREGALALAQLALRD